MYIADDIARRSLVEVPGGWSWAFDPFLWARFRISDTLELLKAPKCPVALIYGGISALMPPSAVAGMREHLPPGSPIFAVPEARHHIMVDQPLAFVGALRGLLAGWPG